MTPIVFCHYGASDYLRYTLRCAQAHNLRKPVVLLGDAQNKRIAISAGVRHHAFTDFDLAPDLQLFNRVYRLVQGPAHQHLKGGRDWVKFVFQRWFYVHHFIASQGYGPFWHFDSDTMILDDLGRHEPRLAALDCTEQCNGKCMNGFIAGPAVVRRYTEKINDLFQRPDFLAAQQTEFNTRHPDFAFTEMRAYLVFKSEEAVASERLNTVVNGETFDDCICQDHGLEMEPLPDGRPIKRLTLSSRGTFHGTDRASGRSIRMLSLNLSWVPDHLFAVVWNHARGGIEGTCGPRSLARQAIPFGFRLRRWARRAAAPLAGWHRLRRSVRAD